MTRYVAILAALIGSAALGAIGTQGRGQGAQQQQQQQQQQQAQQTQQQQQRPCVTVRVAMHGASDRYFVRRRLATFLSLLGRVDSELEVPSQVQYIDATFEPDERGAQGAALDWLGRMAAAGACLFECFADPPSIDDVQACVCKQLLLHQQQLAIRGEGQDRPDKPRLWILSAGRPEAVLETYEARPMPGWPAGFWQAREAERMHLVIVSELPEVREALSLRLFGRGATLAQALRDLKALPHDASERRMALPLMAALHKTMSEDDVEEQDIPAYQELMAIYAEIIHEAEEKGLEQGIREGRVEGERAILVRLLARRFGPLPEAALERIRHAELATLERWTDRLLSARTLDEVLD